MNERLRYSAIFADGHAISTPLTTVRPDWYQNTGRTLDCPVCGQPTIVTTAGFRNW